MHRLLSGLCGVGLLVLADCGKRDPNGSPVLPLDLATAGFTSGLHAAFAGPTTTHPDTALVTPTYPIPASALYRQVRAVAAAAPRTTLERADDDHLVASYVVRSRIFAFRDRIVVQASPAGPNSSELRMYSRSLQGYYDFGVNRVRLREWIAALSTRLRTGSE